MGKMLLRHATRHKFRRGHLKDIGIILSALALLGYCAFAFYAFVWLFGAIDLAVAAAMGAR